MVGNAPLPVTALADRRFIVGGLLGRGGFGEVYEVEDRATRSILALKLLHRTKPGAVARFKQEFRALTELHHPNLARLYELHHEGERWFFTMELVAGVDPLHALAIAPVDERNTLGTETAATETRDENFEVHADDASEVPAVRLRKADPGQLRRLFAQIASGVAALHRAGLLHADLKPSNILVDRDGRVRLLDFGLVTFIGGKVDGVMGTPRYMAPELLAGGGPSPASDWFAFGVILHQALTGQLAPRRGPRDALLSEEPGPLAQLCRDLLAEAPEGRPTAVEIFAVLGIDELPGAQARAFVGREAELARLRRAWEQSREGPEFALVLGTSGIGKSALARHFLAELDKLDEPPLVIAGRCYQQEALPLKALDGVVDSLSRRLRSIRAPGRLTPVQARALVQLFPVLATALDALSQRASANPRLGRGSPPASRSDADTLPPSRTELRRRALDGLAELLTLLARGQRLIIYIDDLQWGDAESGEIFAQLLARRFPILLVATCRTEEADDSPFLRGLADFSDHGRERVSRIELAPLAPVDCRQLVASLLADDELDSDLGATIAAESDGSPLFIEALVSRREREPEAAHRLSLRELLVETVIGLAEPERELLELVAVASQPTARDLLFGAARATSLHALDSLRGLRLVRLRQSVAEPIVESYHDRIRETVLELLEPTRRAALDLRLAESMSTAEHPDRGRIARHFAAAGARTRAIPYAIAAAEDAVEGLAFARAAELYELAIAQLDEDDSRRAVWEERRADALVEAGRSAEAAKIYESLAPAEPDPTRLLEKASEQWMVCGQQERGVGLLCEILPVWGIRWPKTDTRAVLWALGLLARMRVRGVAVREAGPRADESALRRLDLCHSAGRGLIAHDFGRGLYFHVAEAWRALDSGDPLRGARGLIGAGNLVRSAGLGFGEVMLTEARRLAARFDDPYLLGYMGQYDGFAELNVGRDAQGLPILQRALTRLEGECTGTAWEASATRALISEAQYLLGLLDDFTSFARESYERACGLNEVQAMIGATQYYGLSFLIRGEADEARRYIQHAVDIGVDEELFSFQRASTTQFLSQCDLHEGEWRAAWDRVEREWPAFVRSGVYYSSFQRARMLGIRAVVIANALDARARGQDHAALPSTRALLRQVRRCARGLRRLGHVWATCEALRLDAVEAAHVGRGELARALLERCSERFAEVGIPLRATVARACLAQHRRDGAAFERELAALADAGLARPRAWLRVLGPGFDCPAPELNPAG